MAKKFAFVSIGILCLALSALIGFHIGNQAAQAQTPALHSLGHNGWVLDSAGQVWNLTAANCWERMPAWDIPVPLADVKWWDNHALITQSEIAWRHDQSTGSWINCGPWPGSPVPTSENTWGNTKEKYRGKSNDEKGD